MDLTFSYYQLGIRGDSFTHIEKMDFLKSGLTALAIGQIGMGLGKRTKLLYYISASGNSDAKMAWMHTLLIILVFMLILVILLFLVILLLLALLVLLILMVVLLLVVFVFSGVPLMN